MTLLHEIIKLSDAVCAMRAKINEDLDVGDVVWHEEFGRGVVIKSDERMRLYSSLRLVMFDKVGYYLPLHRLQRKP